MIKISKLYQIERDIKELTAKEKHRQRQQRSLPVLRDLKRWLDKSRGKAPKDALISKALPYANSVEKIEALLPWNVKNQMPSIKRNEKNQHIA